MMSDRRSRAPFVESGEKQSRGAHHVAEADPAIESFLKTVAKASTSVSAKPGSGGNLAGIRRTHFLVELEKPGGTR